MLKILCVGLPRTGTTSLVEALRILGYNAIHYQPERLPLFPKPHQSYRVYDDVDAAADLPVPLFWREIMWAYGCPLVLTTRPVDEWWESIKRHSEIIDAEAGPEQLAYAHTARLLLYGTEQPDWYWWRRRYMDYNDQAFGLGALRMRLGCDWDYLPKWLGRETPSVPYPWVNSRR